MVELSSKSICKRNDADDSLVVFVPAKVAATVLLPHVSDTTRMARRSTPTRLLPRPLRHKGSFGWNWDGSKLHGNWAVPFQS